MVTFRFNYRKFLISRYPDMKPYKIDRVRGLVYLLVTMLDLFEEQPEVNVQRDGSACVITMKWRSARRFILLDRKRGVVGTLQLP